LKEKEYNQISKEIEKKIVDLKLTQQQLNKQLEELKSQRQNFASQIEKKYLSVYEHISSNKDGALSEVNLNDKSCGKCHMRLTQQEINEISKYEEFVFCESCSRILYIPKDLEKIENL